MKVFNVEFDCRDLPLKQLIKFAETRAVTTNIPREYLVTALLEDDNVLSQICEKTEEIGSSLRTIVLEDIDKLWQGMSHNVLEGYNPSIKRELPFREYQQSLERIVAADSPAEMMRSLISHYSAFGAGKNAQYIAFRWHNGLIGIENPDDITLDRLFCIERQKTMLIENTSNFLQGLPANNALLYGDSGSGKSSVIKALLNKYYHQGLRLIEISKDSLGDLPQLVKYIRSKKLKYIVFMDDLSFETNDMGYKNLKVLLDGQVEKQPENSLLYATSNRLHLINETWKDRECEEVHFRDTMNEKLSLSERFGIRVGFESPKVGEQYFDIVKGILEREDISFTDEIRNDAARWASLYNGQSGRTASQFVKDIIASKIINAESEINNKICE